MKLSFAERGRVLDLNYKSLQANARSIRDGKINELARNAVSLAEKNKSLGRCRCRTMSRSLRLSCGLNLDGSGSQYNRNNI